MSFDDLSKFMDKGNKITEKYHKAMSDYEKGELKEPDYAKRLHQLAVEAKRAAHVVERKVKASGNAQLIGYFEKECKPIVEKIKNPQK